VRALLKTLKMNFSGPLTQEEMTTLWYTLHVAW